MKFLIISNAPHVKTGYGVQCAYLAERLKADGHDVAIAATYGQQGGMATWRGMPIYPIGYEPHASQDIVHDHAMHFFDGDPLAGWIITITDVWVLTNPLLKDFQVASWTPVDHYPVPPLVADYFHRTGATPIAMSRDGERALTARGLAPVYIPLSVDTQVFKPTPLLVNQDGSHRHDDKGNTITARDFLGVPREAFVVGMVAMNKGWSRDRKGFNEALRAFGLFWRKHPEAVLYMHTEKFGGAEGINLPELAVASNVPEHALIWSNQYAYRIGFQPWDMAAVYTAMDVLIAPSHGEGFCVPLVEAQACGTSVIATDFTSQRELASPEYGAAGWLLEGQPEWDPPQHSNYIVPSILNLVEKMEEAYNSDLVAMQETAISFAQRYDTDVVYDMYWRPFLQTLEPAPPPAVDKPRIPTDRDAVAVIVPVMRRPHNVAPLVASLIKDYEANVYFVCDDDDDDEIAAVETAAKEHPNVRLLISDRGQSFAQKVNSGYTQTTEPWLFLCGDDVRMRPGWVEAARRLSNRYDVIGTNDTDAAPKNKDVAAGRHADHFFMRRSYIDERGGSLDGPGIAAPEAYFHWYVDKEIVGLAKARGVFSPCLDSVVVHDHPGYENKPRDDVYMAAIDNQPKDERTWFERLPLVEMQRVTRSRA